MKHWIMAAALSCSAFAVAAQESVGSFAGTWETSWGAVAIEGDAEGYAGKYGNENGQFFLDWDGGMLTGYWVEDESDQACDEPIAGSDHWGRLLLTNSKDAPGFKMKWGYCDGELNRDWRFDRRLGY